MQTISDVQALYFSKLSQLVERAHQTTKENFPEGKIQRSQLLSIKTGLCPEDCSYCPQSARYNTDIENHKLMSTEEIVEKAKVAKATGATRFCMGASWRQIPDGPDFDSVLESVQEVSKLGLETCCTLGMLTDHQATRLRDAGLDYYNHNIDTSESHYNNVITTRSFKDRMRTIESVQRSGVKVCTGGILGMGESDEDRVRFIHTLVSMSPVPQSITVNTLVPFDGTPLENQEAIDPSVILRVIATIRILAPTSYIRLSAGRAERTELEQFALMYAGANSIFTDDKLLTSSNPTIDQDQTFFKKYDLQS